MKTVALEITDVKSEFEGGVSFSIDWYTVLRQAAEVVIENLNPESLKRVVPIYGGLTNGLQVYYCPSDVRVPSRLYTNDRTAHFDFVPASQYWAHRDWQNKFTLESINGVRFIVIRYPVSGTIITIDSMDDATGWTGVPLSVNTFNYLPGSTASLQGTFSDSVYAVSKTLDTPQDISAVIDTGIVMLPLYLDTARNLSRVEILLKTDDTNYYKVTTTQDSVGDYTRDGQNMLRFWLANKTTVGSPDSSNITKVTINVVAAAGSSVLGILGKLTVQSNVLFFLEYFSNQLFIDGTTGAWKSTPVKGDSINLEGGALNVFHFEACRITIRKTKTERVDGAESTRMDTELARAYSNFYKDFPSSARPATYSILPDIPHEPDPYWGEGFVDLPDRVGFNQGADLGSPQILFADDEDLSAHLNGVNTTFTLAHAPAPAASLLLVLNGEVLMEGSGYTLGGKTITLLAPYYTLSGVGFVASYRYYAGT